jgi:hypothetical protein
MISDIKEKWGKIRSIGGMSPSKEKDAATSKWFEEGEFKDWLVKLENSLPKQVLHCTLLYSTLLYSTLLYSTLLYSTLLHSTFLLFHS